MLGIQSAEVENFGLATTCDATVLIFGETGTGKSTLARRIHEEGTRKSGPFVSVNLASLHEETIESTLFGHERGAFTGADKARTGRMEMAEGGTLFLDEIGELSLPLQARLLEFLQTKTVTPLGSNREKKINTRVICATNRDLEKDLSDGKFREDLYHRIRVLRMEMPPLASLNDDLFSVAIHECIERLSKKQNPVFRITKEVAELLECYSWPGNYRELENVIEVALLKTKGSELVLEDLPSWFIKKAREEVAVSFEANVVIEAGPREGRFKISAEISEAESLERTLERLEASVLRHYIALSGGNIARAARTAGVPKATFYRKAKFYGLADPHL